MRYHVAPRAETCVGKESPWRGGPARLSCRDTLIPKSVAISPRYDKYPGGIWPAASPPPPPAARPPGASPSSRRLHSVFEPFADRPLGHCMNLHSIGLISSRAAALLPPLTVHLALPDSGLPAPTPFFLRFPRARGRPECILLSPDSDEYREFERVKSRVKVGVKGCVGRHDLPGAPGYAGDYGLLT